MIRLNKDAGIGTKVYIPEGLSWQADEKSIAGDYVVAGFSTNRHGLQLVYLERQKLSAFDHSLREIFPDWGKLKTTPENLAYLTGEYCAKAPAWQILDPNEYQPSFDDEENDYTTQNGEKFGFWYLGGCGGAFLSSEMVNSKWCYTEWEDTK
jgi:hypothetical protein